MLAEVTAINCLQDHKSPRVCNILPEMLQYEGDSVHPAVYLVILANWYTEQAPQDLKQDKCTHS